jgi:hypothetical protein
LVVCAVNVGHLVWEYFQPGSVFLAREFLPLVGAVAAGLYFVVPKWGHWGLIGLTVFVLLAIGESDARATGFHLGVLGLLVLPFLGRMILGSAEESSALHVK